MGQISESSVFPASSSTPLLPSPLVTEAPVISDYDTHTTSNDALLIVLLQCFQTPFYTYESQMFSQVGRFRETFRRFFTRSVDFPHVFDCLFLHYDPD